MRVLAIVVALMAQGSSCGGADEPATPPKKVVRGVDVDRIPVPNHGPEVMAGEIDKARRISAPGKAEAEIDGKVQHFDAFGPGNNAATYDDETKAGRLVIRAGHGEGGFPRVDLRVENIRLDELEFPITFPVNKKQAKKLGDGVVEGKEPTLSIRFYHDQTHYWELDPAASKAGENELTLASFQGEVLTGKFRAKLIPHMPDSGKPIDLQAGTFEVKLRLSGVRAGPEAAPDELAVDEDEAPPSDG
jgi:hypothetical protein